MTGDQPGGATVMPPAEALPRAPAIALPPEMQWRKLSPRMLVMHPVQELIRAVPALAAVLFAGHGSLTGQLWALGVAGLLIVIGLTRYFTTTFRIAGGQVQLRKGLIRRKTTAIPLDRVRTVDVSSNPLHRILALGKVKVGTGQADRKRNNGIELDALTIGQATALRDELLHRRDVAVTAERDMPGLTAAAGAGTAPRSAVQHAVQDTAVHAPTATLIARMSPSWLRFGPCSLSGAITALAFVGLVTNALNSAHLSATASGPARSVVEYVDHAPGWLLAVQVVVAAAVVIAVASTAGYLLAFWRFTLVRYAEGTLQSTRGLLTTRSTTIAERRLRGVELSEPLLLRAASGARCIAIATGLRVGGGSERGGSLLLPPAPAAIARQVAAAVLTDGEPLDVDLVPHGPAARRRRYTRALVPPAALVVALLIACVLGPVPLVVPLATLVLLPMAALLAADRYRSLGHARTERHLVTRFGSLVRRRCMLETAGIIGFTLRQSFFQRRLDIVTLTATTAAGRQHYRVSDLRSTEAVDVAEDSIPGLLQPFLLG